MRENYVIDSKRKEEEFIDIVRKFWIYPYKIWIERCGVGRTLDQNDYLFGVIYRRVAEHTGFMSVDEVHDEMMKIYWKGKIRVDEYGLPSSYVPSSAKLQKWEMMEYIEWLVPYIKQEFDINLEKQEDV